VSSNIALDGSIANGRHTQPVRVYYEDTDFSGVVYHASYLRFMERGRTNYLRLIGADHRALFEQAAAEAPGFAFVVRHDIDFKKPAHMRRADIVTSRKRWRARSRCQQVMRGDELLGGACAGRLVSGGRARPIPAAAHRQCRPTRNGGVSGGRPK
jgi:acyl-CoA thioester hydrolase